MGAEELIAKLEQLGASVMTVVWDATEDGARVIQAAANDYAPSPVIEIQFNKTSPGFAEIAIGFPKEKYYYQFFETGATAHEIEAANRQALKFESGGVEFFAKAVSHPGMRARPFLRPAVDEKEQAAADAFGRRIVEEIRKYEESH
jgi:HK97 gp10 family phage protein